MEKENKSAAVWYLGHSGFAVRAGNRLLIFDYVATGGGAPWKSGAGGGDSLRAAGLDTGVIEAPEKLAAFDVNVFISHRHGDHFDPSVFGWKDSLPNIRYFVANGIRPREAGEAEVDRMKSGQVIETGGLAVETLESTDLGVAFVAEAGGLCIYHAGDLNWWHWEGEPEADNRAMAEKYKEQIGLLRGRKIDLAFVPVDPRLGRAYAWGLDTLMRTADVRAAFPMHFWEDTSVFSRLDAEPCTEPYRNRIVHFAHRGQRFACENGAVRPV